MMSRSNVNRAFALAAVVFVAGCGSGVLDAGFPPLVTVSGGGGGGGSSSAYTGTIGDSLQHGSVAITVSSALAVTGSISFTAGSTVTIAGTVDTVNQELHATGSGYTLTAFTNNPLGTLTGVYSGPAVSGFFVAASDSLTGQTHITYCGPYTSTNSNGRMTIQVLSGGGAAGFAIQQTGTAMSTFLSGTVISGSTLTGVTDSGVAFSGTLSVDQSTITGAYAPPVAGASGVNNATGTFTATRSGC
jgi:hypothetical protein